MSLIISLRRYFMHAMLALLILAPAGCQAVSHTCAAGPPRIMPVDPCADVEDAQCLARLAFVRKAFDSTVRIHSSKYTAKDGMEYSMGTGEVIDDRGTVLTAYHVVVDARQVVVSVRKLNDDANNVSNVRDIPMAIVASNPELDIALLRPAVPEEKLPTPFVVRRNAPAVGEELWHFGNVSFWVHGKVMQADVDYGGLHGLTKVRFPCRHGDSGGPFVDMQGRLVGVLLRMDSLAEGRGHTYYMPVGAALDALGYRP